VGLFRFLSERINGLLDLIEKVNIAGFDFKTVTKHIRGFTQVLLFDKEVESSVDLIIILLNNVINYLGETYESLKDSWLLEQFEKVLMVAEFFRQKAYIKVQQTILMHQELPTIDFPERKVASLHETLTSQIASIAKAG